MIIASFNFVAISFSMDFMDYHLPNEQNQMCEPYVHITNLVSYAKLYS